MVGVLAAFCCCQVFEVFALTAPEILARAKAAIVGLDSVKLTGQTTTGMVDVTHEEAAIDYKQRLFHETDTKNAEIVSTIYCKDEVTYLHQVASDTWMRFGSDIGLATDVFNKKSFFDVFPESPAGAGFLVTFAGKVMLEKEQYYRIQSNVFDSKLAQGYIRNNLDTFVPPQVAKLLEEDEVMLKNYLNVYTKNLQTVLWISAETFVIKKIERQYNQITGPSESIPIRREVVYYDFNKPFTIDIPNEALEASLVSIEDMQVR